MCLLSNSWLSIDLLVFEKFTGFTLLLSDRSDKEIEKNLKLAASMTFVIINTYLRMITESVLRIHDLQIR